MPDRVLINGKGSYKYNNCVPDGIDYLTTHVEPSTTLGFFMSFAITLYHEVEDFSHVSFRLCGKTFRSLKLK
ncbi:hypothetical protein Bca4012_083316 [Brassica carinata]